MNIKINLSGLLILTILITGCSAQNKPSGFDYGHVENSKYVNAYFDFEIVLPADWVVQSKEQTENLVKTGTDLVAGDDAKMKAVINASEINAANLLMVYQYEVGSPVEYNPSIMLIAENIKNFPGVKTGSDYLFQARRLLEQSQFKYDSLDAEFVKEVINGIDFYKMNAQINYMGINIKQVYYSAILKGFSFNVIISFINDQQKLDLLKSINSMKFEN